MLKRIWTYLFLAVCCIGIQAAFSPARAAWEVRLSPELVTVGATYNGGTVDVTGTIPSDAEIIIEVQGEKTETRLLKKEHVNGILWMNNGEITLGGLPAIYMLYLPEGADELASTLDIGFEKLKQQATVVPEDSARSERLDEFFKLKKKEGLYAVHDDAVEYGNVDGVKSFFCKLLIPAAMHEGTYTVKTSAIRNGVIYQTITNPLKVEEVGLPAFIRSLAFNHGLIYGILATLIAIFAGLLMGYLFQGEKGAH